MFKIDLIVWKCRVVGEKQVHQNQFKIDLIVWKSTIIQINRSILNLFKIDLIVWKFRYGGVSARKIPSLK